MLVFVIVASALAQGSSKLDRRFGTVVWLYMLTTFVAAALSVVTSKLFPQTLVLAEAATADVDAPGLWVTSCTRCWPNIVSNPVASIMNGNYIGILMWACLFGLAMKRLGSDTTKNFMANTADAVSTIVRWVINLAPFGIMGLVFYQRGGQRPVHLHSVRPPAAVAGGHDAADGAGHQPADHLHLPAPQPVPAGASAACVKAA